MNDKPNQQPLFTSVRMGKLELRPTPGMRPLNYMPNTTHSALPRV
jgi:hypothetical protein